MELGAVRKTCDWEFELREETIELMLPEIQEIRSLARLVALRARLAVLDGKTDEAMHWLQTGYVMSRHVSEGTTLIQALVGIAISSVMNATLLDLMQAPGTPSLFWALADRPEPFTDMRSAMEFERIMLERYLPSLQDLDGPAWSLEHAREFTEELQTKLLSKTGAVRKDETMSRMGLALLVAREYPEARKTLLDEGRPAEQVEAMPVVQVVALVSIRRYYRLRDEAYKWVNLPYFQVYNQLRDDGANLK